MTNPTDPPGQVGPVYLDYASTAPVRPEARAALSQAQEEAWADPGGRHTPANRARLRWEAAKAELADGLGCRPDEIVVTGSGTAAVHQGLVGLARGRARVSADLAHSAVEHSSVIKAAQWWAADHPDATVASLPVDDTGRVDLDAVREALDRPLGRPLGVLAVQSANHEVGTLQPVEEVAELAASAGVPLFLDAAASAGRLPLPGGWAAAAVSAHKWGGPVGVGLLLVRKGARWRAPFPTDERLDPRAAGFENVPALAAAAAALTAARRESDDLVRQAALIERLRSEVPRLVPDVQVVGAETDRLPHLLTFSVLYVDGESLVQELDRHGFAVASGSACAASTLEPSHVLAAMGALTHGNVRLSVGAATTDRDIDRFLGTLPVVVAELRGRLQ